MNEVDPPYSETFREIAQEVFSLMVANIKPLYDEDEKVLGEFKALIASGMVKVDYRPDVGHQFRTAIIPNNSGVYSVTIELNPILYHGAEITVPQEVTLSALKNAVATYKRAVSSGLKFHE